MKSNEPTPRNPGNISRFGANDCIPNAARTRRVSRLRATTGHRANRALAHFRQPGNASSDSARYSARVTTPPDVLRVMLSHHLWATEGLVHHLVRLPRERLNAAVPGTYGSILETLTHLMDADERYLLRLRDPSPQPYEDLGARPLEVLLADLRDHALRWEEALERLERGDLRATIRGRQDYPDVENAEGLLLLQAIHHGNDHRTQICSILGALGLDVPDLDGWSYWAEGRV